MMRVRHMKSARVLGGGGGGLPQNVKLVPYDVSEEMSSVSNPEQAL